MSSFPSDIWSHVLCFAAPVDALHALLISHHTYQAVSDVLEHSSDLWNVWGEHRIRCILQNLTHYNDLTFHPLGTFGTVETPRAAWLAGNQIQHVLKLPSFPPEILHWMKTLHCETSPLALRQYSLYQRLACCGQADALRALLRMLPPPCYVSPCSIPDMFHAKLFDCKGMSLLSSACVSGSVETVQAIWESFPIQDSMAPTEREKHRTPLHYASTASITAYLLSNDSDALAHATQRDTHNNTPMHYSRNADVLQLYLTRFQSAYSCEDMKGAVLCAIMSGHDEVVYAFREHSHFEEFDKYSTEFLEETVFSGSFSVVSYLIKTCNADVNLINVDGVSLSVFSLQRCLAEPTTYADFISRESDSWKIFTLLRSSGGKLCYV
eukprot:PhF_6_TR36553/c0_g1_i2/m.53948